LPQTPIPDCIRATNASAVEVFPIPWLALFRDAAELAHGLLAPAGACHRLAVPEAEGAMGLRVPMEGECNMLAKASQASGAPGRR